MVAAVMAARPQMYSNPELAPWSGNYGNLINGRIKQMLQRFAKNIPGAEQIVAEEVAKKSKGKSTSIKEKSSPITPKKRKRQVVKEEEGSGSDVC